MVDAVDDRLTVGDQSGEHERGGGAEIGSENGGGAERSFPSNNGATSLDFDIGAHAHQLLSVHKTILKNIFGDNGCACGLSGKRHVLRLHVGGEAGVLF